MSGFSTFFIIGLVVGAVTFTTSTTSIFLGVREKLSKLHPKLEELIHCPWCSGFWLSLLINLTVETTWVHLFKWEVFNLFMSIFASLSIAGLLHYVLLRAYEPVAKAMAMRHKEKLMNERKLKDN